MSAPHDLVLVEAAMLAGSGVVDIGIVDGMIRTIGEPGTLVGTDTIDLEGRLCIGAFVDAHCHLDKAFLSEEAPFAGTYGESFFNQLEARKRATTSEEVTERMRRALHQVVLNGTGTMRAQIDVDDIIGLTNFEAAVALREELADLIDLQIVVFPQEGLAGNPRALQFVEAALDQGADVMGGAHGFDRGVTNAEHLERCFDLAVGHDVDLDLHIDFDATPDWAWDRWDLHHVVRLTEQHGWQGRVTVAHLTQHGQLPEARRREMVDMLLEHDIGLVVVPGAELNTARAWAPESPCRHVVDATADWPALIEAGVPLAYAGGHLADAFHPHGEGDLLRDGLVLAASRNLGDPIVGGCHVLTMGTNHAARCVGNTGPYGPAVGASADLIVLDAVSGDAALRRQADRWLVIHRGKPVASTRTTRQLLDNGAP